MQLPHPDQAPSETVPTMVLPAAFTESPLPLPSQIARKLGYNGAARFVTFYYESRGDEVLWRDHDSYGFGTGGWLFFLEHIAPLARDLGLDLGTHDSRGTQALVIDRVLGRAHFADRDVAIRFVAGIAPIKHRSS